MDQNTYVSVLQKHSTTNNNIAFGINVFPKPYNIDNVQGEIVQIFREGGMEILLDLT